MESLPTEIEVLHDVVDRFETLGLKYMLTGSLATSYYAEPRMTRDLDFVVALSREDSSSFQEAFASSYYVPDDVRSAIEGEGFFNLIHLDSVTKVDIVVRKDTPYRLQEFERRRSITVEGLNLWIVSKEDLMLSKLVWAQDSRSEVQLSDVRALAASGYDRSYVRMWIGRLGLEEVWDDIREGDSNHA